MPNTPAPSPKSRLGAAEDRRAARRRWQRVACGLAQASGWARAPSARRADMASVGRGRIAGSRQVTSRPGRPQGASVAADARRGLAVIVRLRALRTRPGPRTHRRRRGTLQRRREPCPRGNRQRHGRLAPSPSASPVATGRCRPRPPRDRHAPWSARCPTPTEPRGGRARPASAGSTDAKPGITRRRRRPRVHVPRPRRPTDPRRGPSRAGSARSRSRPPGPTSGSAPTRAATSRRRAATPGAASSTATTRRSASTASGAKYERHARVRRRCCRAIRERVDADLAPPGPAAREGAGRGRAAAGADADPGRQRGVRAAQPVVRAHDAARPARDGRRQPRSGSGSAARAASPARGHAPRPAAGARRRRGARTCPARTCSSTSTRTARSATSGPRTSTPTCARSAGARRHRQGLPDLGRDGARVPGAAGAPARRDGSRGAAQRRRGRPPDGRGAGQHAGRRAQELRPPGGPRGVPRRRHRRRARRGGRGAGGAARRVHRRRRRPASSTCCGSGSSSTRPGASTGSCGAAGGRPLATDGDRGMSGVMDAIAADVRGHARPPGGRDRDPAHRSCTSCPVDRHRVVGVARRPRSAPTTPLVPYLAAGGGHPRHAAPVPARARVYRLVRPPLTVSAATSAALQMAMLEEEATHSECAACGAIVDDEWVACPSCGTELAVRCASCGRPLELDWRICAWCAAEVPWDGEGRPSARRAPRGGRDRRSGPAAGRCCRDGGAGGRARGGRVAGRAASHDVPPLQPVGIKNAARPGRGPDRAA